MVRVLVIGDSYADAEWVKLLGVIPKYAQAVSGSTARQWADNENEMLGRAVCTGSPVVIISLMGNDGLQAMKDGKVTPDEVYDALGALCHVRDAIKRERTIVFLYPNPYGTEHPFANLLVTYLNFGIRAVFAALPGVEFINWGKVLGPECFSPPDIHPNELGQKIMAEHVKQVLEKNETS